jgi:hypothetical protein
MAAAYPYDISFGEERLTGRVYENPPVRTVVLATIIPFVK